MYVHVIIINLIQIQEICLSLVSLSHMSSFYVIDRSFLVVSFFPLSLSLVKTDGHIIFLLKTLYVILSFSVSVRQCNFQLFAINNTLSHLNASLHYNFSNIEWYKECNNNIIIFTKKYELVASMLRITQYM